MSQAGTITLATTLPGYNTIIRALGKLPFDEVSDLLIGLYGQAQQQVAAAEAEAATEAAKAEAAQAPAKKTTPPVKKSTSRRPPAPKATPSALRSVPKGK